MGFADSSPFIYFVLRSNLDISLAEKTTFLRPVQTRRLKVLVSTDMLFRRLFTRIQSGIIFLGNPNLYMAWLGIVVSIRLILWT